MPSAHGKERPHIVAFLLARYISKSSALDSRSHQARSRFLAELELVDRRWGSSLALARLLECPGSVAGRGHANWHNDCHSFSFYLSLLHKGAGVDCGPSCSSPLGLGGLQAMICLILGNMEMRGRCCHQKWLWGIDAQGR